MRWVCFDATKPILRRLAAGGAGHASLLLSISNINHFKHHHRASAFEDDRVASGQPSLHLEPAALTDVVTATSTITTTPDYYGLQFLWLHLRLPLLALRVPFKLQVTDFIFCP